VKIASKKIPITGITLHTDFSGENLSVHSRMDIMYISKYYNSDIFLDFLSILYTFSFAAFFIPDTADGAKNKYQAFFPVANQRITHSFIKLFESV
jgi:hypothetical protein